MKHFLKPSLPLFVLATSALTLGLIGSASAQKTQMEFWTIALAPLFNDEMNRVVKAFNTANPSIEVKWVDVPANAIEQKLLAAVAAGRPPGVVNLASDMAVKLVQQGALTPLTLDDATRKLYFAKALNTFSQDGKLYGLSWYWAPKVVAYNTSIFKQAGLSVDKPPLTLQTLMAAATSIKDKTKLYGFMPNINATNFLTVFQEAGLPILDKSGSKALFNGPAYVKILQQYVDLYKKGYIPQDTMRRGYVGATELYSAGKLGMLITGPQFLLRVQNDNPAVYAQTKVAPYPIDLRGNVIHTPLMGVSIPKGVRDMAAAQKFAQFVTNDANQLAFSKVTKTTFPSTVKASLDPYFKQGGSDPISQARLISSVELKKAQDLTVTVPNASTLFKVFKDNVEAAMSGQKSAQQALDDAVKTWNANL